MTAPPPFGAAVHVHAETRLIAVQVARTLLRPHNHIVQAHNADQPRHGRVSLPYNPADGWPGEPLPGDTDDIPVREGDHTRLRRFPTTPHPGVIIGDRLTPTTDDSKPARLCEVALQGSGVATVVLVHPDDLTAA